MNIPFDFSIAGVAATASYVKLFDQTANLILANVITANIAGGTRTAFSKLNDVNLGALDATGPPTGAKLTALAALAFYLRSLSITVSAAARVRLGVVNAALNVFAPVYATYSTEAVAGGLCRELRTAPLLPQDNSAWFAALEVTPDATGTIKIAGDIEILPHGGTV